PAAQQEDRPQAAAGVCPRGTVRWDGRLTAPGTSDRLSSVRGTSPQAVRPGLPLARAAHPRPAAGPPYLPGTPEADAAARAWMPRPAVPVHRRGVRPTPAA